MFTDEKLYDFLAKYESDYSIIKIMRLSGRSKQDIMQIYDEWLYDLTHDKKKAYRYLNAEPTNSRDSYQNRKIRKAINQYDREGNYIATFDYAKDAIRSLANKGNTTSYISSSAKKKNGLCYGYAWRYVDDGYLPDENLPEEEVLVLKKSKPSVTSNGSHAVVQLSLDGAYINTYLNATRAGISIGKGYSTMGILKCCRGTIPQYEGYIWVFEEEYKNPII